MTTPRLVYRRNVAAIIQRGNGDIFVAARADYPESWQFPQGGIDRGERADRAVLREVAEETGMTSLTIVRRSASAYRYRFEKGPSRKFIGQSQIYFLLSFTGSDTEIDLDASGHREFSRWKWIRPEAFPIASVYRPRQPIYRAVFQEFFQISL